MGHEVSGTVVEINGSTAISVGQDAFVFLCSDAASYVIGADMTGGR